MIEEQYVSVETAKLAKEKGFRDIYCDNSYPIDFNPEYDVEGEYMYNPSTNAEGHDIAAPSQALLARWLREKHNIHVEVGFGYNKKSKYRDYCYSISNLVEDITPKNIYYDTFEEAMEDGLKEALKFI